MLSWADKNLSIFPWRQSRSPYEILIAEVLLKRTTAAAVARVYEDFLLKFPSLLEILAAPDEELVRILSSVGLQRQRARALKRLATWLLSKHGDCIPRDLEGLLAVPGLGNYSANAILSFGHDVPAAVLDGNVERILLRVFGNVLPSHPTQALLNEVACNLAPEERHQEYNYGLLDLGRQVCRYVHPRCGECPLASVCDFSIRSSGKGTGGLEEESIQGLPRKLRAIRLDRGLSLVRLAEIANISKLTVIRIEAGKSSPRFQTLEKLAQALQVLPEELSGSLS